MSIYNKGKLITSKFVKGKELNKCWRKGHLVFSKPLYKFLANIKQMGIVIDEDEYVKSYYSLDPSILNSASIVLLPYATTEGFVYGMDNITGDVIPFTFSRNSSATLFDSNKNMQLVGSDIPRIDYGNYADNAKLLIEKESTNYTRDNDFNLGLDITGAYYELIDYDWAGVVIANKAAQLKSGLGVSSFYYKRSAKPINNPLTCSMFYRNDDKEPCIFGNTSTGDGSVTVANSTLITPLSQELIQDGIYKLIGTYTTTNANAYFGYGRQTITLPRSSYVIGYQSEDGSIATSYIPTTDSQVTRSADLLSINLRNESTIYLKTTKQETTLQKPAGLWNIHEDLNNEGIELLVIS